MANQRFVTLVNGVRTLVSAISASLGASSAGQVICTNASGVLDPTLLPAGVGMNWQTLPAPGALTAGQAVNLYSASGTLSLRPADNTIAGAQADGFVLANTAAGAQATALIGGGTLTGLTGIVAGARYYLGVNGALTTTAPTASGTFVQALAVGLTSTSVDFQPSPDPVTVA